MLKLSILKLSQIYKQISKSNFFRGKILMFFLCIGILDFTFSNCVFAESLRSPTSLQGLAEFSAIMIRIFTFMSLLLMNFAGDLLGTKWLTSPDMVVALTGLWVYIRNITNILLMLSMIYLVVSNLISSYSEGAGWTIKEKLPKLLTALVLINFSFLAFKIAIDVVNVGSTVLLSINDTALEVGMSADVLDDALGNRNWERIDSDILLESKSETGQEKKEKENLNEKKQEKPKKEEKLNSKPKKDQETQILNKYGKGLKGLVEVKPKDPKKYLTKYDEIVKNLKTADYSVLNCNDESDSKGNEKNPQTLKFTLNKGRTEGYVCLNFQEKINNIVCPNWRTIEAMKEDKDCLFKINNDYITSINPDDVAAQNLFMAFGSQFMHLEKLPMLAANLDKLGLVISNTLFSAIMASMYAISLAAIFFALAGRIIILWLGIAFSPALFGLLCLGLGDKLGSNLVTTLINNLIMPIKISAAFAVSFMMLTGLQGLGVTLESNFLWLGPSLSGIGSTTATSLLWQIATVVIFWQTAKWAIDGNIASKITDKVFSSAQTFGTFLAKKATLEAPIGTTSSGKQTAGAYIKMFSEGPKMLMDQMDQASDKGRDALLGLKSNVTDSDHDELYEQSRTFTLSTSSEDDTLKFVDSLKTVGLDNLQSRSIEKIIEKLGMEASTATAFRNGNRTERLKILRDIEGNLTLQREMRSWDGKSTKDDTQAGEASTTEANSQKTKIAQPVATNNQANVSNSNTGATASSVNSIAKRKEDTVDKSKGTKEKPDNDSDQEENS